MELLHAYWRMEYIQAPKKSNNERANPFTGLRDRDDEEAHIVLRRSHSCVLLNRFPYNAGHLLALPYRAVPELEELTQEERFDLLEAVTTAKVLLRDRLKPDGFNIGLNQGEASGAGIPSHLHFHIVPRWKGDTNFMPVIGDTRVLPMALESMWKHLHDNARSGED